MIDTTRQNATTNTRTATDSRKELCITQPFLKLYEAQRMRISGTDLRTMIVMMTGIIRHRIVIVITGSLHTLLESPGTTQIWKGLKLHIL